MRCSLARTRIHEPRHTPAQPLDKILARDQVLFFGIEYERKGPTLELLDAELGNTLGASRVAHDIDQPIDRVHAAEQIVVFAIGPRQERREMSKPCALETLNSGKALQGTGVLRADAIVPDFIEFADFTRIRHRKGEHFR